MALARVGRGAVIWMDQREEPAFRDFFGERLARSRRARVAVRRIRLARLDLAGELKALESCRVLLGRLDAASLAPDGRARPEHYSALLDLALSGRLEVRSAGLAAWEPDFSVLDGPESVLVFGNHQFAGPSGVPGPLMTVATMDPEALARAGACFEELWARGHDVLEAVTDALLRAVEQIPGVDP